jgi:hypothetical protein
VTRKLGPKWTLFTGLLAYCAYIGSFLVATIVGRDGQWVAVLGGSAISGIGAGLLWPAQGLYFQISALALAEKTGLRPEETSGMLAGVFTGIYMGFEVLMKILSSTLELERRKAHVYAIFCVLAGVATLGMMLVRNLKPVEIPRRFGAAQARWTDKAASAMKLLCYNKNCRLLAPMNFAFGFGAALLQYYGNKFIVTDYLQPKNSKQSYVGFAGSIAVGSGALVSLFFGFLTKRIGKHVPMMLGNVCFFVVAISFLVGSEKQLGTWTAVVPIYMVYGIGRGIWESVNKAINADLFPDDAAAAFANITMQSGFASSMAFFIFPNVHKNVMACFVLVSSMFGIMGFATVVYRTRARPAGEEKVVLLDSGR